ncbi:hypothetical protein Efla_004421 [Eimeria flavescens]
MADLAKLAPQLTPVESLRAVVLLEEALKQLAFLGKLVKDPKTIEGNQVVGYAGDEIIRIIAEQQELGEMYQQLSEEKQQLKGLRDRKALQDVDENLSSVFGKLKQANRDLCRNLRQNPNIQANLMKLNRERQRIEEWLTETVNELKATNTFKCLIDNVAQEKHRQERLSEATFTHFYTQAKRRNREIMQAVRLLEAELKKEAAEYAENRRVSSVEISKLKEELQKLRMKAAIKLSFQERSLTSQLEGTQWLQRQEEEQQEEELLKLQKDADMDSFIYTTATDLLLLLLLLTRQLQNERERLHQLHQEVNERKQQELTLLLKKQNSLSRALGTAQSRIEEEERVSRELAAAEHRSAWISLQRQKQKETETQAALALQHFARAFLLRIQEAEKKAKASKKKGKKSN